MPPLTRLIAARRFDLYQDAMPDVPTFEGYAGETHSALYQMGAMILNGGRPVETGDAAGHLGVAHALIGHLRAFGHNASKGRIFLPWSVFAANGVAENDVLTGRVGPGMVAALEQLSELAADHLAKARDAIARLDPSLRPVMAPVAVLEAQRRRMRLSDPFSVQLDVADWRKILLLTFSR